MKLELHLRSFNVVVRQMLNQAGVLQDSQAWASGGSPPVSPGHQGVIIVFCFCLEGGHKFSLIFPVAP